MNTMIAPISMLLLLRSNVPTAVTFTYAQVHSVWYVTMLVHTPVGDMGIGMIIPVSKERS